jgi:hypothetical protein
VTLNADGSIRVDATIVDGAPNTRIFRVSVLVFV